MKCPVCDSDSVEETDKFDLTQVDHDWCTHDFQCNDCEALYTITYAANHTSLIARNLEALRSQP